MIKNKGPHPSSMRPAIQLGFLSYPVLTKETGLPGEYRHLPVGQKHQAGLRAVEDWVDEM